MGIDQRPLDALRHLVLERLKTPMERVHGKDGLDDQARKICCMMLSCLVIESSISLVCPLHISPVVRTLERQQGK